MYLYSSLSTCERIYIHIWEHWNFIYTHISITTCIIHCPHSIFHRKMTKRKMYARWKHIYTDDESFHIHTNIHVPPPFIHTCSHGLLYECIYICFRRCGCVSVIRKVGFFGVVVVKMGWPSTPISSSVKTYELGIAWVVEKAKSIPYCGTGGL